MMHRMEILKRAIVPMLDGRRGIVESQTRELRHLLQIDSLACESHLVELRSHHQDLIHQMLKYSNVVHSLQQAHPKF